MTPQDLLPEPPRWDAREGWPPPVGAVPPDGYEWRFGPDGEFLGQFRRSWRDRALIDPVIGLVVILGLAIAGAFSFFLFVIRR